MGGVPKVMDKVRELMGKNRYGKGQEEYMKMMSNRLQQLQDKNQKTFDEFHKEVDNAEKHFDEYKRLSHDPFTDASHIKIDKLDANNIVNMSNEDIDKYVNRATSIHNKIQFMNRTLTMLKQLKKDPAITELAEEAEKTISTAREMASHIKDGQSDPITEAYTGGATNENIEILKRGAKESLIDFAKRMTKHIKEIGSKAAAVTQWSIGNKIQEAKMLIDKTSEVAKKYLPQEVNSLSNVYNNVVKLVKGVSNEYLNTNFDTTLRNDTLDDRFTGNGFEVDFSDLMKNAIRDIKEQKLLVKTDVVAALIDLVGDYSGKTEILQLRLTNAAKSATLGKDLQKRSVFYEKDRFEKICGSDCP